MSKKLHEEINEDIFDEPVIEEDLTSDNSKNNDDVPCPTDKNWSDYVIAQFGDDEKYEGNPTVDGLRRVAELLVGEIVDENSTVLQLPDISNEKRSTVRCCVKFLCNGGLIKTFDGVADAYWGNCNKPFYKYPTSIAETRAEARALRKALKLQKVVAAEEISNEELIEDQSKLSMPKEMITDTQINFIDILCKNDNRGLNINVEKFVKKMYSLVYNIRMLEHSQSLEIQKTLSSFQQDKNLIPTEVIGYCEDWRTKFA